MKEHKVKIYSTQYCPYCKIAKEFFKQNKIQYKEINVAGDAKAAQEMIKKSGQVGVTVIDIDGQIVVGFDQERLKKLLVIK